MGPFSISENVKINTRLVSEEDSFVGPITSKEIENIAVAKIGDEYFKTLADAILACPENSGNTKTKIEMLANTTESVVIPEGKNIVLDLCGATITGIESMDVTITVNGKINLIDSAQNEDGTLQGNGKVVSENGTAVKVMQTGYFVLGTNESATGANEEVDNTNPVIQGTYGVLLAENAKFEFYDGEISGKTESIMGIDDADYTVVIPTDYMIFTNEEGEYEVATLKSTITVTFDANGGIASFASKDVITDIAYGSLPTVEQREGYSFLGWRTANNQISTNEEDWEIGAINIAGELSESNNRLRLKKYLKVSPNTHYLLTTNSSELINPRVILLYDKNLNLIKYLDSWAISEGRKNNVEFTTPENCEYIKLTLINSYTSEEIPISLEDLTKANIQLYATITENTKVIEENNHILKAAWQANEYIIVYNANGGTGTIEDLKCTYDNNITISQNIFTLPEGYTFKEWNTKQDGTGIKYEAGQEVKNLTSVNNETIILYAIWEDKTAPTITKPTGIGDINKITVNSNQTDAGSGIDETTIEYSIFNKDTDAWSDWQSSNVFEGLNANTEYEVKTRVTDKDGNGPVESEVGKISTSLITNGTIQVRKNNEQGEVITPETNPDNKANQVNTDIYIDITPSTTGTTIVTVKAPNGEETKIKAEVNSDGIIENKYVIITVETGKYEIVVETTDGTNIVTDTYYIFIDKTEPIVESTITKTTNTITVNANVQDTDSGIAEVTYTIKKGDVIVETNTTGEFTGLEDNTEYTVEITVTDRAGNTITKTENVKTEELVAGSIAFTEITSGETIIPAGTSVDEVVWVNENVNTILTQGSTGTTTYEITVPDGIKTTYTADTQIATTEGNYLATLITTDGTNTKTVEYYFSVDKTLPVVTINLNEKDYTLLVGENALNLETTISVTENESGLAITKYAISTSNTEIPEDSEFKDFVTGSQITENLQGGEYYVWVKAQDNAGNIAKTETLNAIVSGKFNIGYTVEYNLNGGTGDFASFRKPHGQNVGISLEKPVRDGYIFKGWSEFADTSEINYAVGGTYVKNESKVLYAVWSEAVASTTIGEEVTLYASVQQAIDAAGTNEGVIVTLLKDEILENVTVAAGQDIVLDTNDKTLTSNTNTLINYGDLVIDGTGTITSRSVVPVLNKEEGNLHVINGNVIALDSVSTVIHSTSAGDVIIGVEKDTSMEMPHIKGRILSENDGDIYVHSGLVEGTTWRALHGCKNIIVTGGKIIVSGTQEHTYAIITQSADSVINISGGIIESGKNIAVTTTASMGGKIVISGGEIYSESERAIYNAIGETEISGGTIKGVKGIYISTGTLAITGGIIEGTEIAIDGQNGNITIGTLDEEIPSITTPRILGGTYGITGGKILNFYDGIIIGSGTSGTSINGTVTDTPTGYTVTNGIEIIDELERETAYLVSTNGIASTKINQTITYYPTVQEAIDAAGTNEGATVTLLKDEISEAVTIKENQNIILNLNGNKLTNGKASTINNQGTLRVIGDGSIEGTGQTLIHTITNNGTLIKDGKSEWKATNTGNNYVVDNNATGTFIMNDGTLTSNDRGLYNSTDGTNNGTIIINGGIINTVDYGIYNDSALNSENNLAVQINGGNLKSTTGVGVYSVRPGRIEISNATIVGNTYGIHNENTGTIIIDGASITGEKNWGVYNQSNGNITIYDGYIVGNVHGVGCATTSKGELNIYGGTIIGVTYDAVVTGACTTTIGKDEGNVSITSPVLQGERYGLDINSSNAKVYFYDGIFKGKTLAANKDVTGKAEGYDITESTEIIDGAEYKTAYLKLSDTIVASSKINETTTYYSTVQEAIDAVGTKLGATVTLLKDEITEIVTIAAEQDIVLDTNGKTLTSEDVTVTNNGTLSISGNGKIISTGSSAINNDTAKTLTIDEVTIESSASRGINNTSNGTVNILGGYIKGQSFGIFDNDTGIINIQGGTIEAVSGTGIRTYGTKLNISGDDTLIKGNYGIYGYSTTDIEMTGGKIQALTTHAIRLETGTLNVSGEGIVIEGVTRGITTTTGNIIIRSGTVKATNGIGIRVDGGTLTLGVDEENSAVNITTPYVIGTESGVEIASGTFNFYDGIIIGTIDNSLTGTVADKPTGYEVVKGTETIDDVEYETSYLEAAQSASVMSLRLTTDNTITENDTSNELTNNVEEQTNTTEQLDNEQINSNEILDDSEDLNNTQTANIVQILDNYYTTIQAAIDVAKTEDTLILLDNITLTEEVSIAKDKNIKLNLNDKTLNSTNVSTIINNGTLTITGTGSIENDVENGNAIYNTGTLNIENALIKTTKNGGKAINNSAGIVNINSGNIKAEGISGIGIYNINNGKVIVSDGTIQTTNALSKCIYNDSSLEILGGNILVSNYDAIGIYNLDNATKCIINNVEIIIEGEVIKNYETIKDTEAFKTKLEQMKPSYGIYNNSSINVELQTATIKVERLNGVGIINKLDGTITFGIEDSSVSFATPIIYAIQDNTTAIINSENGNINFYDGRITALSSLKELVTNVLTNYELYEEIDGKIINTVLKEVEI